MSRLTTKIEDGFYVADHAHNTDEVTHKLGKLEDLEEQIGCPLEVVFKAIYSGIYYIYPNGNIVLERSFKLNHYSSGWCLIKPKLNFKLEDYKKTWWLKRDKSE